MFRAMAKASERWSQDMWFAVLAFIGIPIVGAICFTICYVTLVIVTGERP